MAGIVVVFDFDRTLIDDDSDRWVVVEMGLTSLFNQLRATLPWNSLMVKHQIHHHPQTRIEMDRMMEELHSQGKTSEDIAECLKRVPLHPQVIEAIKTVHALGCDLKVLSDANQFFIETILRHHEVFGCFSEIITNPTFVDGEGRLRIFPCHDLASTPHNCHLCPPNLCKGSVIEKIQASTSIIGEKRLIYLGDGSGDFCPTLKLHEGDHVMARANFSLWKRISNNPTMVKAEIHVWSDGEELGRTLLQLTHKLLRKTLFDKGVNCQNV